MASGGKQPSQSKQESGENKKEEMQSFYVKERIQVCERFEKLQVISRLLEQPEEQSQGSSKSRQKSSRSRKVYKEVYQFFCDQPSTSQESKPKSVSEKNESDSELPESNISENKPSDSRISKTKSSESNVSETNPSDSRISKTKSSDSTISKTKSSDSRISKTKPSESSVSETGPSQGRKSKIKSAESSVSETNPSESRISKTKSSDSRISKTKPSESSVSETGPSQGRKSKIKSAESSVSETNPSESRISKTKPSEGRKSKTKSSESSVSETNLSDSRISKTKPSESRKSKTKSSESSVSETNLSDSRISKIKPSESRKSKTKSSESSVSKTNPSESEISKTKSSEDTVFETNPSESSTSKTKPSGSSKRISSKKKKALVEKFDTADLSKEHGDNYSNIPTVELPTPTQSSIFDEQPYIEDPEAPSTSSGLKVVKLDEFKYPEFPSISDLSQEEVEQGQSNIITSADSDDNTTMDTKEHIKRSNLRSVQKKTHLSSHPEKVSAVESVTLRGSYLAVKQTKPENPTDEVSTESKIDLKNVRAADLRGRLIFKLNEAIQNRMIPHETPKSDRAQRARERLRRKFEEGQSASSNKKSK